MSEFCVFPISATPQFNVAQEIFSKLSVRFYLRDFILTLLGLALLSFEKKLTDLILSAVAIVGFVTGRLDLAKPFIFGAAPLAIIPPYLNLPGLQTLSVLVLLKTLNWRLNRTNILTLALGSVLAQPVIESFPLTDMFGVLVIYLLLVVRGTWILVSFIPLPFLNWPMLFPALYIVVVKHFRLSQLVKVILFIGFVVTHYLLTERKPPADVLAQVYGPLFPILFLTIHRGDLRLTLTVFGVISSEYLFIFFKSNSKRRFFKGVLPFMLLMAYISSKTLPRVAHMEETIGVVTLPDCEAFKRTQTGLCKIFLDLWDQGFRLCFQNQVANPLNDCRGRVFLPVAGVARSDRLSH